MAIVYCDKKSGVEAVRVTCTVPLPVIVPGPLMTIGAVGITTAFAFTVKLPPTLKLVLAETAAAVLEIVRLLYVLLPETNGERAVIDCTPDPS